MGIARGAARKVSNQFLNSAYCWTSGVRQVCAAHPETKHANQYRR
jgi:hypothetical protein